jgi:hypothetical protein
VNDHWEVLYQVSVFYVDRKSKMTATACSLDGPLQTLGFLFRYEIQNGGYGKP